MAGYDQFFKEAQKATGLIKGNKPTSKKASTDRSPGSSKSSSKSSLKGKKGGPEDVRDSVNFSRSRSILNRPTETPEQRLRAELATRMREKKSTALRRKKKFPLYPVACTMAALLMCGVAFYFSDELDTFAENAMSHIEIGVFGDARAEGEAPSAKSKGKADAAKPGAEAKAGQTASEKAGEKTATDKAASEKSETAAEGTPLKGWTTEEMAFFSKLNDRKKELDAREADLSKLDEELQKRKVELDEKLKQLEAMREEISKALKTRVTTDKEKVAKLVEFYSTMKPQQASKIIETLNEDLAVQILDSMKKKNAAEVLNVMDAKKARRLSELLTGYQRTPASANAPDEVPAASEPTTSAPTATK